MLWATGVAIVVLILVSIWTLLGKPKLLAKLTVVAVLTINSLACIWWRFRPSEAAIKTPF